jgi:hypothetical protein
MAMLFLSETAHFLSTNTRDKLDVDTQLGGDIEIDFDISFPRVPCSCKEFSLSSATFMGFQF